MSKHQNPIIFHLNLNFTFCSFHLPFFLSLPSFILPTKTLFLTPAAEQTMQGALKTGMGPAGCDF
jgi:hypothetical protein